MYIKISVIMPTFNSQKFLGYALMSIKDHVDEIIIMDMGSTDNTRAIIDNIKSSNISFHLLKDHIKSKEEHNLDYSIKYALDMTEGDVVMRVDDDWIWGPEIKELRGYCEDAWTHHKRGLMCFVYNLITTDKYFFPVYRRPTIICKNGEAPIIAFGSYKTDNNFICHADEVRGGEVVHRRSAYMRTPLRFGHWKFLKDDQKSFIRKWIMFRGGTEEEALKKWHYYQGQPTEVCPRDLSDSVYTQGEKFIPLGGFDVDKAVEREIERKKKFERAARARAKTEMKSWTWEI